MSLLKSNSVQIGQSATATNNFTLSVPSSPDGTIKLARGNSGATTADILSVNASGAITGATINGGAITSGTETASTSGTAIDFTSIPSWVKRVTVMFNGVSTNGSSVVEVRIGSGSISASGYYAVSGYGGGASQYLQSSTGFNLDSAGVVSSTTVRSGALVLALIGSNTWVGTGSNAASGVSSSLSGNSPALSGPLDRVRITTVNGTDTFDAGSVNIMYEG